jgi:hypothetical protein
MLPLSYHPTELILPRLQAKLLARVPTNDPSYRYVRKTSIIHPSNHSLAKVVYGQLFRFQAAHNKVFETTESRSRAWFVDRSEPATAEWHGPLRDDAEVDRYLVDICTIQKNKVGW